MFNNPFNQPSQKNEDQKLIQDLNKTLTKRENEIKSLKEKVNDLKQKLLTTDKKKLLEKYKEMVKAPCKINFRHLESPNPNQDYSNLITTKKNINNYEKICKDDRHDRYDEIILSYHLSIAIYNLLNSSGIDKKIKKDLIKSISKFINDESTYIISEEHGLNAFFNEEYHTNTSSSKIEYNASVEINSFVIRDKSNNEILRKAIVKPL